MKKLRILVPSLFIASLINARPQEVFSRTFMYTRPAYWYIAMDQQLWHSYEFTKKDNASAAVQLIPYYLRSRSRAKDARYFLFERKQELFIAGDNSGTNNVLARDVRAEWVDLPSDFTGYMTVNPAQTQIGGTIYLNYSFKNIFPDSFFGDWTIDASVPVTYVENNMNFCQYDVSSTFTEANTQPSIIAAFNNPTWRYAKIPACKQSMIRPGQIKVTLGSSYLRHDEFFQMSYYGGLVAPMTNHASAEYLFSPMPGNNRHAGLVAGIVTQILLNHHPEKFAWSFFLELEGTFLIRNKQHRTYDLQNKPWSRYLQYVRPNSLPGESISGVNLLTFPTLVRPFGVADCSFGWRINTGAFEFEVGYDIWGHGGEVVKLRSDDVDSVFNRCGGGYNLFGIAGNGTRVDENGITVAATASLSTIDAQAPIDPFFVPIVENDIDLFSAQAGSALNQKIHASVGIQNNRNIFGGFGFVFEFAQKNSPLTTFQTWFKIGGVF